MDELLEINKEIRDLVKQEVSNQKTIIGILWAIKADIRLLEKRSRRDVSDTCDAILSKMDIANRHIEEIKCQI